MKLRFRNNSLRFRVNRPEVEALAAGRTLEEQIYFPGNTSIRYVLEISRVSAPQASFEHSTIRVTAPHTVVRNWAENDVIGMYFELATSSNRLDIAVEKDFECLEAMPRDQDPNAFSRRSQNC